MLKQTARVFDIEGCDLTLPFVKGAEYALSLAKKYDIEMALLKEKSPSCGVHLIYNGSKIIQGFGVTTALLKQSGIKVFSENELNQLTQNYQ